jgi:hypothetical protein
MDRFLSFTCLVVVDQVPSGPWYLPTRKVGVGLSSLPPSLHPVFLILIRCFFLFLKRREGGRSRRRRRRSRAAAKENVFSSSLF